MPRCKRCPTAITCCGFGETVPREPAWRAYARACRRAYLPRPQRRALPRLDGEPVRNRVPDAREHAHIEEQRLRNVVEAFTRAAKVVPQARSASPWLAFAPRPAQSGTLRRGRERGSSTRAAGCKTGSSKKPKTGLSQNRIFSGSIASGQPRGRR